MLHTFFSRPKRIANPNINIIVVDLVIVYREIVTSSRPQFEKPTSIPLARPVGATDLRQVMKGRRSCGVPVIMNSIARTNTDSIHFIIKWYITTVKG